MTNAQWAVTKAIELNEIEEIGEFYAGDEADNFTTKENIESLAKELFGIVQRVTYRK